MKNSVILLPQIMATIYYLICYPMKTPLPAQKIFDLRTPYEAVLKTLLVAILLLSSVGVWGQTATYAIASTSSVSTSGTAPSGSSATYSQTYTTTAGQMTLGKSTTLTLSGYAGKKITSIVLSMKSNGSAGAGTLSVVAGSTTIASVSPAATFSSVSWYGNYSTSYVTITKTPSAYNIAAGENVVITIAATVNSLYIQSYTIVYADACTAPTPTFVTAPSSTDCPNKDQVYTTQSGMTNYQWTLQKTAGTDYTIISGGGVNDHTMTVRFHTKGGNRVSVGYTSGGCASTAPAIWDHMVNGVSIGPLSAQNIVAGTDGNQLNASEDGTIVSREWKYSTTSGGSFVSFSTPVTGVNYIPNFATAGTYYVVCESTFTCGTVRSNEITISVTALQKPVISSANNKTTTYGTAGSYQIAASNSPTSFAVTSPATLPAGFSFNAGTGVLSSADNTDAGTYVFYLTASNSAGASDPLTLTWTQNKKNVTISGVTVTPKVYDQTTAATPNFSAAVINTLLASDAGQVSISNTGYVANFNNKNFGTNKTVTITGVTLTGARSSNYNLTAQPTATGNITKKDITISGIVANDKQYDTNTSVTFDTSSINVNTIYSGDTVTYTVVGAFQTATAGNSKPVDITAVTLGGTDGGNYQVIPLPTGITANITKADPVISPASLLLGLGENRDLTLLVTSTNTVTPLVFSVPVGNGIVSLPTATTINADALGNTTLTITQASNANYNAASVTIPVTVEEDAAVVGDYKTVADGAWATVGIWQVKTISGWEAATSAPLPSSSTTFTNEVLINSKVSFNVGNNTYSYSKITVNANGELSKSGAQPLLIAANGRLLIKDKGNLIATTLIRLNSTATFEIQNGGTYTHNQSSSAQLVDNIFAGIEKFHPTSNFIVKTLSEVTTSPSIRGLISDFSKLSAFDAANTNSGYFGNIIFETDAISTSLIVGVGTDNSLAAATDYAIAAGDIVYRKGTSTSRLIHVNNTQTTTTASSLAKPYKIGGSLKIEIGYTGAVRLRDGTFVDTHFKIGQNLEIADGTTFQMIQGASTLSKNLYVNGNIIIEGNGSFLFSNASASSGSINLHTDGNINVSSTGTLTNLSTTASNIANIFLNGKGDGTIPELTQTLSIANSSTLAKVYFHANTGSYVQLADHLNLGSLSKFNVVTGATLDFGFNGNTALNITGNTNGQTFTAQSGSILKITSPYGLTNTAAGETAGNVQVPVASRNFNPGAIYHYIGKVNQETGNALPEGLNNKVIVDLETDATKENLEFTSTGITKFNSTGTLEIRRGKVSDIPGAGFRNNVIENEDGESDAQKGNILMKGGRYIVSGSGTKPSLSGSYTLSAGTVEFTGDAATKIRTSTLAKQYYNVDVSGFNVETGGKNFIVNNLLKVTAATAKLTVPETLDNENPYVVTAKKGIQIAEGGQAIFKNNANLMQEKDAVNTGNITMERKATVPSVQYNYWSSPVKDQPLYSLYPGIPDNTVMVYNSANDRFTVLPTSSNPKSVFAKGYSIKGSSNTDYAPALTATFVGEPHNETTAGINSILLSTAGSNYNLIGNPYPSNLNLLALFADEDNKGKFYNVTSGPDIETPTAYFWDNTSNTDLTQQGSGYVNMNYASLNLSTGIGTPAPRLGTTGKKPNGIVKPGQGFIMRAAESGGSLTFKNTHRTTLTKPSGGTDGVYYKANEATTDKFWLTLTTPNQMNVVIALAYHPEAENSFERFDSMIFSEAVTENFYSLSSDARKLAIQSRKGDFNSEDKISLGIKSSETGLQKISLESKYGVFENQPIYLKDKLLNTLTNLSEIPYEFTMATGVDDHRFEIVYKPGTVLATDNGIKEKLTVYRNANDFIVKSKHSRIDEVEVYDVSGRLIIKVKGGSDELRIDASSYISGTYVLKIKCDKKEVTTKILK